LTPARADCTAPIALLLHRYFEVFVESTLATEAERRYRLAIGVAMAK
jgi:hypothetical protein